MNVHNHAVCLLDMHFILDNVYPEIPPAHQSLPDLGQILGSLSDTNYINLSGHLKMWTNSGQEGVETYSQDKILSGDSSCRETMRGVQMGWLLKIWQNQLSSSQAYFCPCC